MAKNVFLLKAGNGSLGREWTLPVTLRVPVGDGKQEKVGKGTAYEAGTSKGTRIAEEGQTTPRRARVCRMRRLQHS